ncbi:MAG: methionine--tRNA ligase [Clostridia bacterium]|nr:methionine--tRNA ligase [Clostridia bacterium]
MAKRPAAKADKKTFYITTPIYYASGALHIGHCYTTVCCDAIARFKRMDGYDVYYLTGTDEHGQKVQQAAEERGMSPQAFVDSLAERIKALWTRMDISNDGFIRTTDKAHEKAIADIFTKLYEKGDIYKSEYVGKYCEPCESFWTESQLVDGKCPDCGRPVKETKEECYFFRLGKYADRLKKLLTETDFLQPDSRVKEMVNNFIDKGLSDLAVTRTSFDWGIKVPFDPKHVIYVWIDALPNYITALGYGADGKNFSKYWPCDMHVMAKEIVRFHSIVWPAILMALDIPVPKRVYGHGWIMFDGDKMSKSKGNVVDPFILTDRYGVDALRYFLLRAMPFGDDMQYSNELLLSSINNDIVNDLGNLVRRTFAMSRQYFGGAVKKPAADKLDDGDKKFIAEIDGLAAAVRADMDRPLVSKALERIFGLIDSANKYIDANKPWALIKTDTDRLNTVMYVLLDAIRVSANLLLPFLTAYPRRIFDGLGLPVPEDLSACAFGKVDAYKTTEIEPILNRLDIKKELSELEAIAAGTDKPDKPGRSDKPDADKDKAGAPEQISIDEFFKTELRVVKIEECVKVEKSNKLLKLTVFDGERRRTIVSGIAHCYAPEDVIGKNAALVANLKPAKLCGIVSEGMLLCSVGADGKPKLVEPKGEAGEKIC